MLKYFCLQPLVLEKGMALSIMDLLTKLGQKVKFRRKLSDPLLILLGRYLALAPFSGRGLYLIFW